MRSAEGARQWRSCLPVLGPPAGDQLDRVRQRRLDQREPVAAPTGRAGQVHDQRLSPNARRAAAEQTMWRLADCVRAQGLGNPGDNPVQNRLGRLGREVARRHSRPARREDDVGRERQLSKNRGDLKTNVRNEPVLDVVVLRLEQLDEECATLVLSLARRDAVGHRHDRGLHRGCFVFSTRATSVTDIPESIALAMSYTVKAATDTAVSASISTPVCAVVSATPVISTRASPTSSVTSTRLSGNG